MPPRKGQKLIVGDDLARFRSKTVVEGDCQIWTGAIDQDGYGAFMTCRDGKRKQFRAHRWIYERMAGPIQPGLVLMHSCDRPSCVRVEHLTPGTVQQNTRDALSRVRTSRLTVQDVLDIRRAFDGGETLTSIASRYTAAYTTVFGVAKRKHWLWVAEEARAA